MKLIDRRKREQRLMDVLKRQTSDFFKLETSTGRI